MEESPPLLAHNRPAAPHRFHRFVLALLILLDTRLLTIKPLSTDA